MSKKIVILANEESDADLKKTFFTSIKKDDYKYNGGLQEYNYEYKAESTNIKLTVTNKNTGCKKDFLIWDTPSSNNYIDLELGIKCKDAKGVIIFGKNFGSNNSRLDSFLKNRSRSYWIYFKDWKSDFSEPQLRNFENILDWLWDLN